MDKINKWESFVKEVGNLIFFWFFGIVFFTIYRTLFIFIYNEGLGNSVTSVDFINAYQMAFKFDCTVVAYFMILPLVCNLLLSAFGCFNIIKNTRIVCQYLFVIFSSILCIINLNYFSEYNDQFNNFVFVGLYDDQQAILKTIIDYYHPILNTITIVVTIIVGILIFRKFEDGMRIYSLLIKAKPLALRSLMVIVGIGLFVCCIRGSFQKQPAMRKWSAITSNNFLNKTIINPYRSLKYAYEDYKEVSAIGGQNPYGDNLDESYTSKTITELIKKRAVGDTIESKPKQIFLVIMESYDSWPLLDKYSSFGIAENLKAIASKGTHFANFTPAHNSTFFAYSTIITSIPHCGVYNDKISITQAPYMSSIFSQFKELGYKTNMFYGGYLSWRNIGGFTEHLGCDKIYSGGDAGGKSESGDWGIEDEKLFDLVLSKIDPDEYTFNVILTSSYHAPYTVDIYSKGFRYHSEADLPDSARAHFGGGMNLLEMGHLWYGDWSIGQFMKVAETKYPDALFSFTGDHYGRRFINAMPNLYENSSVPFILYGKNIPAQQLATPGSHIDIMPTLIEMVAPKDFTYYSFGKSMFSDDKNVAFSYGKAIDYDSLYYAPRDSYVHTISLETMKEDKTETFKYKDEYNELMKLAWHYIVRGDSLHLK